MKSYRIILIPAYNEEENIQEIILRAKKTKAFDKIIVVDDGSIDRTSLLAKKSKAIVLKHKKNRGKGEALKTGFKYILKRISNFDYVAIIDADLQYTPEESVKLIKSIKNADFVIGYRNFSKVPFRHKLGNIVWRKTFNLLFGTSFKDTNCGLMVMTKKSVEKMDIQGGYIVENSMLASAIENKLKIKQVPVSVSYKKISTISRGIKVVVAVLLFIVKRGLKYRLSFLC